MAGPLETLNALVRIKGYGDISLSIIAKTLDPVTPGPIAPDKAGINCSGRQLYTPTHTFDDPPQIDVLLVPGGYGSLTPLPGGGDPDLDDAIEYIRNAYLGLDGLKPLHSLLSVCTGAALLARPGVLDGQQATSNKATWKLVTPLGPRTHWVARARWMPQGRIWTTSSVSAGIDGVIAWVATLVPPDVMRSVLEVMEYTRAWSPEEDPFAEVHGCADVAPRE